MEAKDQEAALRAAVLEALAALKNSVSLLEEAATKRNGGVAADDRRAVSAG
jgi:hypothetical protein